MIRPFSLLTLLAVGLSLAAPARADLSPMRGADALTRAAALVVTGRVAAVRAAFDPTDRVLYTYVTVEVTETLKGRPSTRVVLKQVGGVTPAIGLHIDGQASFATREEVLLFLATAPRDGTLRTVALGQGKWRLAMDLASGRRTAARTDGRVSTPGIAADQGYAVVSLDDVRAWAAASPTDTPYMAEPAEAFEVSAEGTASAAYDYLPTEGYPARWHEVDDGSAIPVDTAAIPGGWAGTEAGIDAAVALWSNAGSSLRLARGGGLSGCPAAFTGDGRIRVGYDSQCGQAQEWVIAGGYYTPGDLRTIGGVTFQKFVQGFVILDENGPQASSAGCFQDAVAHGLGHAVGLGHTGGDSIMNATPPSGCASGPRTLGGDDVNAVRGIYSAQPNSGQAPAPPTAVGATVVASTVTITWTPATTGGIPQSYLLEAGTRQGVVDIGTIPSPGTGTSLVVNDVPQGVYWVRVKARNALGTSSPSPDRQIIVGPCEAPGTPAAFSATGSDTLASFSWTPPAGGGAVQGYRLEVGSASGLANLLVQPLPPSPTSFQATGPYGTYFVRLRTSNACGVSAPTADVQLTLQPCAAPPSAPTALTYTVSPQRVVTLNWTAPATGQPPRDYVVEVGSRSGAADVLIYPTGTSSTSLVATAPPTTYYVRVRAQNACGQSAATTNEQTIVVP